MIERGDGEHAHRVECCGNGYRRPRDTHPDHRDVRYVHQRERNGAQPVDVAELLADGLYGVGSIEPALQPAQQAPASMGGGGELQRP